MKSQENIGAVLPCRDDTAKSIEQRIKDCPVPLSERASFKGHEIARQVSSVARTTRANYDIEIIETKAIPNGIEVLARAWDKNGQLGFGKDGTVDIERFIIINPPVLIPDPTGDIVRTYFDKNGLSVTRTFRESTKDALLETLDHIILVKKEKFDSSKIVQGKVGNTTTTVYPAAGAVSPVDGNARREGVDEVFGTIRAGAGTAASATEAELTSPYLAGSATADQFQRLLRSF